MEEQKKEKQTLYRVTLPHLCAGVLVANRRGVLTIVDAAPVIRWAMGQPLADFVRWVKSKEGKVEMV